MRKRAFEIRIEDQETFLNAAEQLVLSYRTAIVDSSCSWCTEAKYCRRYMDGRSLMDLLSVFVSMVYGPMFNQNDVSPAVIKVREQICSSVAPRSIRVESSDCQ